jgi:hypothetical protein
VMSHMDAPLQERERRAVPWGSRQPGSRERIFESSGGEPRRVPGFRWPALG